MLLGISIDVSAAHNEAKPISRSWTNESAIGNWAVTNWTQACRQPLIWPSSFLLREGFERMRLSSIELELEQPPRQPRLQAAELVGCWLMLGRPGCAIFSNAQRSRGLPRPSGMVNEEETARDWHF